MTLDLDEDLLHEHVDLAVLALDTGDVLLELLAQPDRLPGGGPPVGGDVPTDGPAGGRAGPGPAGAVVAARRWRRIGWPGSTGGGPGARGGSGALNPRGS